MKKKRKGTKALVAAAILASGIYFGSNVVENINDNALNPDLIVMESVIKEENEQDFYINAPVNINENEFQNFNSEKIYTLFKGTQLYDYALHGINISPDVIYNKTMTVRGISTNGEFTLISLPNEEVKYVRSSDIIEAININTMNTLHDVKNDDYTVNKDTYVYNKEGVCIGYINEGTRCLQIAYTDNYAFVLTENDEYFYISKEDITLTNEYSKSLIKPKKLEKPETSLYYSNIWYNDGKYSSNTTIYRVNLDNEVMIENADKPYFTLLKEQPIYFNNGGLHSISYDYGIKVRVLRESNDNAYVELPDGTFGYVNKKALCSCLTLDKNEFKEIIRNRNYITNDWDYFYDESGAYQYPIYPSTKCLALATDGDYTLVEFSDGSKGYLSSSKLIESEHQVSKYVYLKDNANLYYKNENNELIKLSNNGFNGVTYLFYVDGDYAYIGDYYCRENYFVKLSDIDENYNIKEINSYGYTSNDTNMNANINQTGENISIDDYQLLFVYYNCGEYSYIEDVKNHTFGYIKTSDLKYLDGKFIYIDLDKQEIECFDDHDGTYYTSRTWGTRSGKDTSPSHEGAFDIDWKAENWEFTTYRGSYAHHWIPYNDDGEGIHDLIGDDEENYGNESYHYNGSHGCVRVPAEASEYVYNYYPVGTMVLVNKK